MTLPISAPLKSSTLVKKVTDVEISGKVTGSDISLGGM